MNAPVQNTPPLFYQPTGNEVALFTEAAAQGMPVLIKGPTGCGKTRFVQHMAQRLNRPLYTVACHDDLSAADLVGRHLIGSDGTWWQDGPLTRAVREGGICYLDEVVEARQDTVVVLHPWRTIAANCSSSAPANPWWHRPASCWWCRTTPATRTCSRA